MSNGNSQSVVANMINNAQEMPVVFYRLHIKGKASKANVKELSLKAEQENGAKADTVTSLVVRIPAIYAAPIKSVEGKIRNLFYKKAIMLGDAFGVPIKVLPAFKFELDTLTQEYNLHFNKLVEASENGEMETILSAQTAELREKITPPTAAEIRTGYGVEINSFVNFESMAVKDAMKVLADDLKTSLKVDVEASVARENAHQLEASNELIVDKVKKVLKDIMTRCALADVKGIKFATMVEALEEIVNVLPAYNVTNNPEITNLIETIRKTFDGVNKDALKDSETARKNMVAKAQTITAGFAQMFG